jgi:hypothetical protein
MMHSAFKKSFRFFAFGKIRQTFRRTTLLNYDFSYEAAVNFGI